MNVLRRSMISMIIMLITMIIMLIMLTNSKYDHLMKVFGCADGEVVCIGCENMYPSCSIGFHSNIAETKNFGVHLMFREVPTSNVEWGPTVDKGTRVQPWATLSNNAQECVVMASQVTSSQV